MEDIQDKMKEKVISEIIENRIIVIVRGVSKELLTPFCEALYKGGIRLVELTYSADGSIPDEVTAENIGALTKEFEGRMTIGAGTVLTKKQVELTYKAGGKFIISPNTSEEVIKATVDKGMVSIPGALTPTEAQNAHSFGADFVKLFPVTSLGPSYVKAIKAPLSHIRFLAVGGISEQNLSDYLLAGAEGVGVGGNITALLGDRDFAAITDLAKKYVEVLGNV